MKLVCLHCVGGSSQLFSKWKFENIEIIPIDLPGRGKSINLSLVKNFDEAKSFIRSQISKYINEGDTWGIFGHSMGGYLANEIVRDLTNKPNIQILSGINLFNSTNSFEILEYDDYTLIKYLSNLGAISKKMLEKKYFIEWFGPIIRSDMEVLRSKKHDNKLFPTDIPTVIINGKDDILTKNENINEWKKCFNGCEYVTIEGNHFSIYNKVQLIGEILSDFIK